MTNAAKESSSLKPPPGFGKEVNKYLNHYVAVADTKAAGTLTADLALCGYLLTNIPMSWLPQVFHWAALVLLIASGVMALRTIYPRTPNVGSSVVFWEDIAARPSFDEYLKDLTHIDDAEVERQYGVQNYFISVVLSKKYSWVQWSMIALMVAIPLVILKLLFV